MSIDPVETLAMERVVRASAEIEAALISKNNPMCHILARARKEASAAMCELIDASAEDFGKIRTLQNKVLRFDDLIRWLQDIVKEGIENNKRLSVSERDEYADMIAYEPEGPNAFDDDEANEAGIMERVRHDA